MISIKFQFLAGWVSEMSTRQKRFSMMNFGDGTTIHVLFEADGAVDLDDRQHLLDCYSGIAFAAPSGEVDIGAINPRVRRRRRA